MSHTDKFGRTWRYTPGHDTNKMLQISAGLAARGYDAAVALRGAGHTYDQQSQGLEPYLLKSGHAWVMGMRYGNEGHEYISPCLDDRIIQMMVEAHRREAGSVEHQAIWELVCR